MTKHFMYTMNAFDAARKIILIVKKILIKSYVLFLTDDCSKSHSLFEKISSVSSFIFLAKKKISYVLNPIMLYLNIIRNFIHINVSIIKKNSNLCSRWLHYHVIIVFIFHYNSNNDMITQRPTT